MRRSCRFQPPLEVIIYIFHQNIACKSNLVTLTSPFVGLLQASKNLSVLCSWRPFKDSFLVQLCFQTGRSRNARIEISREVASGELSAGERAIVAAEKIFRAVFWPHTSHTILATHQPHYTPTTPNQPHTHHHQAPADQQWKSVKNI